MRTIAVLGSGMAALGVDHRLRQEGLTPILFDKGMHPGGHARTHHYEGGWEFDEGPHVSFTKNERIRELLAGLVDGAFRDLRTAIDNYWRGYWIKHPAQINLHGLPTELVVACISDFIEAAKTEPVPVSNYEDWLIQAFGRTFAETFPMEYAVKVHTTEAANLTTDWLGPRLYRPALEEVLTGALTAETPDRHYVTGFRYPERGGYQAYIKPLHAQADLRMGNEVTSVDPKNSLLRFANGSEFGYDRVISSIPLPDLVPMIEGVPDLVVEAAGLLAATDLVLVNVGIDREDTGETWSYFYDPDIPFARVSYPNDLAPSMAPPGCGSYQAEIYFSKKYRPRTGEPDAFVEPTLDALRQCGMIHDTDTVLHTSTIVVPYANIIHDHDKLPSLEIVDSFLDECGIERCGRYGLWGYHWTDEAFISGEEAAQRVLDDA